MELNDFFGRHCFPDFSGMKINGALDLDLLEKYYLQNRKIFKNSFLPRTFYNRMISGIKVQIQQQLQILFQDVEMILGPGSFPVKIKGFKGKIAHIWMDFNW